MKKNQQKDIYRNRAQLDEATDISDFECCPENLVFAMKDKHHSFSIGLSTILHCLAIAEKEGYVPEIPSEWWLKLRC